MTRRGANKKSRRERQTTRKEKKTRHDAAQGAAPQRQVWFSMYLAARTSGWLRAIAMGPYLVSTRKEWPAGSEAKDLAEKQTRWGEDSQF